jgi:hypothetical protein
VPVPFSWTALVFAAALAGCATHTDRLREIRSEFYAGNVELASTKIDNYIKSYGREADVLKLDQAVVHLSAGRPRDAERLLREVRDSFDYLDQTDLAEKSVSMLTDDTHTAYAGEDYEKILIRALLALANMMGDGGDATAYAFQVGDLQQRIIQAGADETHENPKLNYKLVALGPYLQGLLAEQTHTEYDDAARAWAKVVAWEPGFPYGPVNLDRAQHGRHSARGNGCLHVFALVGRGPYKEEVSEVPSTVALLVADRIVSATTRHSLPPTIAPVKVPKVVSSLNLTHGVQVSVDQHFAGATATVTDVGTLAVQQYQAIYPRVLGRAVARRVLKKGIVYAGKEAGGVNNGSPINLALDVAGVVWEASESADTRCWGLLPDQIQVLRLELPAGEYKIGVHPDGGFGRIEHADVTVRIGDGRNTYLLANFADGRLIGKVTTSEK